jgi:ABC-2 type transport system permease protein
MKLKQLIASAFVIARRDFTATVMSKTFLLFLIGPLFPALLGGGLGGIGARIEDEAKKPVVAVIAPDAEYARIAAARDRLASALANEDLIVLAQARPAANLAAQRQQLISQEDPPVLGVLEGGLDKPFFSGAVKADGRTIHQLQWMLDDARRPVVEPAAPSIPMGVKLLDQSSGTLASGRALTARAGQFLLFFLTLLLAGMVLSQLIEEKSNKVIEILAAAVPVDAIFLGKLFAMLAISLVGILVWVSAGAIAISFWAERGLNSLPEPAVGWPIFLTLAPVYFAMSYLLIGGVFLGIGAQASSVREVQTLSMPVTMAQVLLFGFAAMGVGHPESPIAFGASLFPLSSPFSMIGRAAEQSALWPHGAALLWQALWVALILRISSGLFRRSVLKSGPAFRWPWQKRQPA